jgi:hypothetical protein
MHASSGIRTHGLSVQAIKAYSSDRAATGKGLRHGKAHHPLIMKEGPINFCTGIASEHRIFMDQADVNPPFPL